MAAEQNWAVDELLKSEEEAAAIVKDAQKEQEKKMKQAKMAAEQEISDVRKEREWKFNEEVAAVSFLVFIISEILEQRRRQ